MSSKWARLRSWLAPTIAAVLLCAAFWVLHGELQAIRYRDLQAALARLGPDHLLLGLLCCAANYLVLTCYDQLAFVYVGRRIARARIALTAFIGYAISNSVGFALLSGTAVRHRFYSRWGVGGADLSRIVALNGITYWLGLLGLGGWSLVTHPHAWLQGQLAQRGAQWLGLACLALVGAYLLLPLLRKTPLRVRGFDMRIPPLPLTLAQLLVSATDWMLAASVLYALLPPDGPSYPVVLGAFLAAQMVALLSHVPGGLGVFDGLVALLLAPWLRADQIVAALTTASLEFHVASWLGARARRSMPVMPEIARMGDAAILCIHGVEEADSPCPRVRDRRLTAVAVPCGHHFDGDYLLLVRRIVEHLQQAPGKTP